MITRRTFMAGGVATALLPGCASKPTTGSTSVGTPGPVADGAEPFEYEERTVEELSAAMAAGQLTAQGLVAAYLDRIAGLRRLNAIIEVNPDAAELAAALDRERRDKGARGPLHGIPVVLKDNIDTADRMPTTAGSLALAGTIAPRDAFIVERLRRAGAVILAKANLSEWANFRSTRSSSGWSAVGGQTRNPYVLDRSACGSSSGSGVAVSANLCPIAVGTETDGSIMCPSSANGVVGVKPTVGLVSRSGLVPTSHTQDTAGPMARTVTDAALLLAALAGQDARDDATKSARQVPDYVAGLDAGGLQGAKIGVWRGRFGFHEGVDAVMEDALQGLRKAGAQLVDPVSMPSIAKVGEHEMEVLLFEFKAGIEAYLATRGADTKVRTLQDLIAFNEAHREEEMPYFGQEIFERAQHKGPLTDQRYLEALAACRRLARTEGLDRALAEHGLDAIVGPSGGPAWTIDRVNGDHFGGGSSSAAAISGYPSVSVPAGFVHGLPVGISFIGPAYAERTLLRLAYAFEQSTRARRPPQLHPSLLDEAPVASG